MVNKVCNFTLSLIPSYFTFLGKAYKIVLADNNTNIFDSNPVDLKTRGKFGNGTSGASGDGGVTTQIIQTSFKDILKDKSALKGITLFHILFCA